MPEIGLPELLVILVVLILVFGAGKVGDMGGALGKSVREFRRAAHEPEEPGRSTSASAAWSTNSQATAGRFCSNCGVQLNSDAKFCAQCGAPAGS